MSEMLKALHEFEYRRERLLQEAREERARAEAGAQPLSSESKPVQPKDLEKAA